MEFHRVPETSQAAQLLGSNCVYMCDFLYMYTTFTIQGMPVYISVSVPHCNVAGITDGDDPAKAFDPIKLTLPQQGTPPPATFTPVVKATQAVRHHEITLTRWHSSGHAASEAGVSAP